MDKKYVNDIFLTLGMIFLIVIIIIITKTGITGENLTAEVWHENVMLDRINLSSIFTNGEKKYDFLEHHITIKYKKDIIWIDDADCQNKRCLEVGKISDPTSHIICSECNFRIIIKSNVNTYDVILD